MGYALEQRTQAATSTAFAPALSWRGPAASVTGLTLASTATTYGKATTATVTVTADPVATGAVEVEVAGQKVRGTLAAGTARLTLPATLPVGTHLVTARYAGSAQVAASVATATLKVAQAAPKVVAKLKKKKVTPRQRGRLQVTVTGVPAAGATVLVHDRGRIIRTARVAANGKVTVTLPRLARGRHPLRVYVVAGADHRAAWSSTVRLVVRR